MIQINNIQLICPIRGQLKVNKRSIDGLTPTEEFFRVEAIRYLLSKGYPKENFRVEPLIKRFGSGGRNSFRSDFAILDVPVRSLVSFDPDELLKHTIIICEVKRDNNKSEYVKQTQVKPLLDFARKENTLALYWDNIDKRVFWTELIDGIKEIKEGPLSFIPMYGHAIKTVPLTFETISPADSLVDIFDRINDILHQASFSPEKRYEILLQLLLAKIFDEHSYESKPEQPVEIQDYASLGTTTDTTQKKISDVVGRAVSFYGKYLPNVLSKTIPLTGDTLFEVLRILAPVKIIHSKRDVIQTFYMKFAKDMYKWDMAQYFTPTTITDFIVEIANPQFGEHIADPACGSADFLVAAFRVGRKINPSFTDCVWGVDNSSNAVQIAVLNMVLNGDGKTNIVKDDSLENINNYLNKYEIVICNPPFGTKIVEKRSNVLRQFDLGYEWTVDEYRSLIKTDKLLKSQETGILFIEVCMKECRPGGRIAIILPNGYLGNRSTKYRIVRDWILKHAKIAAIISLPRFAFKSSDADVSASVVYLEKREVALTELEDEYSFAVEMVEKIGWDAGNKNALPTYMKNQEDGSFIVNEDGELSIDCDFNDILNRISNSNAATYFKWLNLGRNSVPTSEGWTVKISDIYNDTDLTLDPKRYIRKIANLRSSLLSKQNYSLGDLVDFIPERHNSKGDRICIDYKETYQYVELRDIGYGDYYSSDLRGWELPQRARHFAEPDDIFFGSIWGSAVKWCYISNESNNVVVTNGCYRCRIKADKEEFLPDLLFYLNSEGWGVQMRAFARGSDGLAEISVEDAKKVIIPLLDDDIREGLKGYISALKDGKNTLNSLVKSMLKNGTVKYTDPKKRPSHIVLV